MAKTTKNTARSALGRAIGSDIQPYDDDLDDLSDGTLSADKVQNGAYFITSAGEIYSMSYKTFTINWLYKITIRELEKKTDLFEFSTPNHL